MIEFILHFKTPEELRDKIADLLMYQAKQYRDLVLTTKHRESWYDYFVKANVLEEQANIIKNINLVEEN